MRRREKPVPIGEKPPVWVRQMFAGLRHFGGDLGAWERAQQDWCRPHGCWRLAFGKPCTPPCTAHPPRRGVLRIGQGATAGPDIEDGDDAA